jgi:hypothetical protein
MLGDLKHRTDGPAVVYTNGDSEYWVNGVRHNEDGPAVNTTLIKIYYVNGRIHRVGGPAIISTGTKNYSAKGDNLHHHVTSDKFEMWIENGQFHRVGGPAIVTDNGDICWYLRGSKHNLFGCAEVVGDIKRYYVNGSRYDTEAEYKLAVERFVEMRKKTIQSHTESIHGFLEIVAEPTSGKFAVEIDGKVIHCLFYLILSYTFTIFSL